MGQTAKSGFRIPSSSKLNLLNQALKFTTDIIRAYTRKKEKSVTSVLILDKFEKTDLCTFCMPYSTTIYLYYIYIYIFFFSAEFPELETDILHINSKQQYEQIRFSRPTNIGRAY